MIEASSSNSKMSLKEKKLLQVSNATKTENQTMTNSCISTDKSPSLSDMPKSLSTKREVNELLNYIINSLESTNSNMKQKVQPSIDLSVFDHLNQIKKDLFSGKIRPEKVEEEESEKAINSNPYVYPNSYNLLPTNKRYKILAEIRDRTDERVLQYEQVLEKLYGNLAICNAKSPYINIINEQKKKLMNTLSKNITGKQYQLSPVDGLIERNEEMPMSMSKSKNNNNAIAMPFNQKNPSLDENSPSFKKYISIRNDNDYDDGVKADNSFEKCHYDDMFQKIILDKDKKKKLNQSSFASKSNSKTNEYNNYIDPPLSSTQQNSTQVIHRNQSVGSFIDRETKSIQFYENKSKRSKDGSQRINITNMTDKSGKPSPIKKQPEKIN